MTRGVLFALVFCVGVTVGGLGGWQIGRAQSAEAVERGLQIGQRPPRFAADDLSGTRHALEQYEGSVLVLHFWASWCPYCRSQIPQLTELHNEWTWKGVSVLSVSIDENLEQLEQFMAQAALPYPVIADAATSLFIGERYGVSGIPVTYILGRDGRIVLRLDGRSDILGAVKLALEEHPASAT